MTTHFVVKNEGPGDIEVAPRGVHDNLRSPPSTLKPGEERTVYVWPDIRWEITEATT